MKRWVVQGPRLRYGDESVSLEGRQGPLSPCEVVVVRRTPMIPTVRAASRAIPSTAEGREDHFSSVNAGCVLAVVQGGR